MCRLLCVCIVMGDMSKRPLRIILYVALLLRAGLLVAGRYEPQRFFTPDSGDYDFLAWSLAEHGEFSRSPDGPAELFRTPGYPLFLAGVYAVSGYSVHAVLVVQILLDVALCWLVYLLGARLFDRRVGLWAAALQAVSTVAIISSVRVLSDSLFAFMLTASVLLLLSHFKTLRWQPLLLGGIVAGCACYVRPVGVFFGVIVLLVLLLRCRAVRRAMVFAVVFASCIGPWILRNYIVADYPGFSTVSAECMFKFQGPYVLARVEGISVESARFRLEAELSEYKSAENPTQGRMESRRASIGLRILREHPWTFLAMHLRGSLMVWAPGEVELPALLGAEAGEKGTMEVLSQRGLSTAVRHYLFERMWLLWILVPFVWLLLMRYAFSTVGVVRYVRLRMGPGGWLIVLTVLLFAILPGVFGHPRFRVPITPFLNVAAGVGVVWFIDRLIRRRGVSL